MLISKMIFDDTKIFANEDVFSNGYALHQAVWALFADSPDRERDFLYRLDYVEKIPLVYTVSKRKPQNSKGIWNIESKEYLPQVKTGLHLGFTVRINPVRTSVIDGKRHDVVMDAKYKNRKTEQGNAATIQELVCGAGRKWLEDRSEKNGFKMVQFRADGYQQVQFYKTKGGNPIRYSTLDVTGVLEVTTPDVFTDVLFNGLGSAKGFGCGLMLVRKI